MQSLPITYAPVKEQPPFVKVYGRRKSALRQVTKVQPLYPRVLMPEQPVGYLKQKEIDCW